MAPKKKKKPASNPARGFATVSLPAKAKMDDGASEAENALADVGNAETISDKSQDTVDITQPPQESSSFQDITADQLQEYFEDAELQNIVEKSAERSKREATRQVARLETERRTLRAQAMPLETDDWLTKDLVQEIFSLHKNSKGKHEQPLRSPQHDKEMQQDDLLVKLWTLQQVLKILHIPQEERVLKHVVSLTSDCILRSKDYIWGLEESLDWLALHGDPEDLPSYEPSMRSSRPFQSEFGPTPSSSEGSRATSPTRNANDGARLPVVKSTSAAKPKSTNASKEDHSDVQPASSSETGNSTDDDNDPDELVSRYIGIKLQLLKLEPEYQYDEMPTTESNCEKRLKPSQVSRLRRRVETIERDILFDHDKAKTQLNETLNQFRADISRRRAERRATKPLGEHNFGAVSLQNGSDSPEAALDPAGAEDAVEGLFGDMFTPAETFIPKINQSAQNEDNSSILLVDFGKWAGVSPRRVLEDTCKSR